MADMKRLLEDGGTPFERALLGAAAREIPAPMLERRMRRALGIGFIATGVKAAMALVPVAAIALITAGVGLNRGEPKQNAELAAPKPAAAPAAPVAVNPPAQKQASPVTRAPEAPVAAAVTPARQQRVERATSANDLKREIRMLDQARNAVRSGESALALDLLRSYDQRFPRGAFRQEVAVLRVEALERRGERDRANDLARKFVAENPDSPHVERVERVTQSE
jgi:TolA-binding protein